MLLQNDANTELSKEIYKNIIKSGLHRATVKTLILPCPDVVEWITRKILGCTEKGINVVMPLGPAHCPGVG